MDAFDLSTAPPEFQAWGATIFACNAYTNIIWLYVYYGMIYRSYKDKSFSMPLISQCLNIAWELTFGYLCSLDHWLVTLSFQAAFISNCGVIYAAIKYGAEEWDRSPMIQRNLVWLYIGGTLLALAGHLSIVAEIGAIKACFMNAIVCQAILSVGCFCQLLIRESTRGFSLNLWFFRFTGSLTLIPEFYLRGKYWPEAFGYLEQPFMLWCCYIYMGFDLIYPVVFWYIQKREKEGELAKSLKDR
ncbi:hypothetical protein BO94DRAFT_571712 [Aspergillus sclerotioniger CBS 115572]|uniref:PaxB n=1 Tax=Aspergillus sclerotioniger CBS 115572 TaxID=1450535 RepID=A0A317XDT4_9EURO|nr:hypothetical protein BO94DRAFT_571712 [Aspergillus sclerotioniger CBS 115572]PWY95088.1 hypothetical protein BO94DRAFT_571712 [Aspergillus sclerotioniger CBS 115572]